jgi:hypothetical protein
MKRREFIAGLGSVAAWPLAVRAQQRSALPLVGVIVGSSADASAELVARFRKGLLARDALTDPVTIGIAATTVVYEGEHALDHTDAPKTMLLKTAEMHN